MAQKQITLSGCAIIHDNKVLLLQKSCHGMYQFPGGKVEDDESIEQTAIRETKEEIGCDVKLGTYLGYFDFESHGEAYQSHVFLATIREGQTPQLIEVDKFDSMIWMPIEDHQKYNIALNVSMVCKKMTER